VVGRGVGLTDWSCRRWASSGVLGSRPALGGVSGSLGGGFMGGSGGLNPALGGVSSLGMSAGFGAAPQERFDAYKSTYSAPPRRY